MSRWFQHASRATNRPSRVTLHAPPNTCHASRVTRHVATACVVAFLATAAHAASTADIRADAGRAASEYSSAQGLEAQQRAIGKLGATAIEFIDAADRAAMSGTDTPANSDLRGAYSSVAEALEKVYAETAGRLDLLAKKVMDEDGDLEALYETQDWREKQSLGANALYYLNWVRFYGARLHEGAKRKELLEAAEKGFSEFAVGDRQSELITESILGRGLCNLELGNTDAAARDFKIVVEAKDASAERRGKAKIGLLDAYLRAGDVSNSLKASEAFVADANAGKTRPEEGAYLRYLRLRALLLAVKKGGPDAGRYRAAALDVVDQLRKVGGAWRDRAENLLASSIDDPSLWAGKADSPFAQWNLAKLAVQKGDDKQARPLLETLLKNNEAEAKRYQPEANYLLGLIEFRAGAYAAAATNLGASLGDKAEYGTEARYLRFKALEALVAKQQPPNPELTEQFRQAATDYVQSSPDHKSAYEAYLRLGELAQGEGRFQDAIGFYEKVKGDPTFQLQAAFGTLQCHFELLGSATGPGREDQLKVIGGELAEVEKEVETVGRATARQEVPGQRQEVAAPGGKDPKPELVAVQAKTAIMRAVYINLTRDPVGGSAADEQVIAALRDFEKKYPAQADLLPNVVRLRLEALERSGRFADANADIERYTALLKAPEQREAVDSLASRFLKDSARARQQQDKASEDAARQAALKLYEIALGESASGDTKAKLTLARLYQDAGEPAKASGIYDEVLAADAASLPALRGLARVAESEQNLAGARQYWERYFAATHPGDVPWYESQYEIARLTLATGNATQACEQLTKLRPAMPGLGDAELRGKLNALHQQACG